MIELLINKYCYTEEQANLISDKYYEFINTTGVMINIHDLVKVIQMR